MASRTHSLTSLHAGHSVELTPCSLPNTLSGSSEWNLLGAKGLIYVTTTDSVRVGGHLPEVLVSFLEALCPALPHTTFFPLSLPLSAWPSWKATRRNPRPHSRLLEPKWGSHFSCLPPPVARPQCQRGWAGGRGPRVVPGGKGCVLRPRAESTRPAPPRPRQRRPEPRGRGSSKEHHGNVWPGMEGELRENSFFSLLIR